MSEQSTVGTTNLGMVATIRRGLRLSPEMGEGIGWTLVLALIATVGRIVIPVTIQQIIDTGIAGDGGLNRARVVALLAVALVLVVLTTICSYWSSIRLFTQAERGLATMRVRTFGHIHSMSTLTQNTERRGALVSRVTSDVDTISRFVQWAGLMLILSAAQLLIATAIMAVYSWQLTIIAWVCFLPMVLLSLPAQRAVSKAFVRVRERMADMLGGVSEAVVGAETIRINDVAPRSQRRIDRAIGQFERAMIWAQNLVSIAFSGGVLTAGITSAVIVVAGCFLGMSGQLSLGALVAFLFLTQLFTGPILSATETLTDLQDAVAGWRRVIGVLETPVDVPDPGPHGVQLPPGPSSVRFEKVSFGYPGGPRVLHEITADIPAGTRVAVVGETGSGKSTMAKLLARLMDPDDGTLQVSGVDISRVGFASLRRHIVLVPQEGFLFDDTIAQNIRFAADVDDHMLADAVRDLGLTQWVESLPDGMDTAAGPRGEALSAGERQLVAIIRAYLVGPDLLILDEATSAVDPRTEVRIQRALERLTAGRTSVTIAHRLSTAQAADWVLVMAEGRLVEQGPHRHLVAAGGAYARMYASWTAQVSS